MTRRHIIQWCVLPVVIVTWALGWKYPWLGFSVPLVMLAGIVGATVRGRYVCGNLCPRGAFFDRMLAPLTRRRTIPAFFRSVMFRVAVLAAFMALMVFRVSGNPADPMHWGRVFWFMCLATTGIGVLLAIFFHPRVWCAFCPAGTLQNAIGGGKGQLRIDADKCKECGLCEKACPFDLPIVKYKEDGRVRERDCLKCSECVEACPTDALSWPS